MSCCNHNGNHRDCCGCADHCGRHNCCGCSDHHGQHGCGCSSYPCCTPVCPRGGNTCGQFVQPIFCNSAQFSDAGVTQGATLVIHKIVLEPCGNQSCTPRTFNIRITGPSFPCGEVFQLRAGSCVELDEPLVITGLEPGTYCIEELFSCPNQYISTFTGPVCGRQVTVSNCCAPTVITIVNRRRECALCHGFGCGCSSCSICR